MITVSVWMPILEYRYV